MVTHQKDRNHMPADDKAGSEGDAVRDPSLGREARPDDYYHGGAGGGSDTGSGFRYNEYYDNKGEQRGLPEHEPRDGHSPEGLQRSDEHIRDDVRERLGRDISLDASEVQVQVENGAVILLGTADSHEAVRRAVDAVRRVSGVRDVHNQLRVRHATG